MLIGGDAPPSLLDACECQDVWTLAHAIRRTQTNELETHVSSSSCSLDDEDYRVWPAAACEQVGGTSVVVTV